MPQSSAVAQWWEDIVPGTAEERVAVLAMSTPVERAIDELLRSPEITIGKSTIEFTSREWDFSACSDPSVQSRPIRFAFTPHSFEGLIKVWALFEIATSGDKLQTIRTRVSQADRFAAFADRAGIQDLSLLTREDVESFLLLREETCSPRTMASEVPNLERILMFYEAMVSAIIDPGAYEPLERRRKDWAAQSKRGTEGSFPPVPDSYLKPLVRMCERVAEDESEGFDNRMMANAVLLASQTAMRTCELASVGCDAIRISLAPVEGEPDIPYIVFKSPKSGVGDGQWIDAKCIMNQIAYDAYYRALELGRDLRSRKGLAGLIVFKKQRKAYTDPSNLGNRYRKFILDHRADLPCINTSDRYPELASASVRVVSRAGLGHKGKEYFQARYSDLDETRDVLVYPLIRQFRSTVATELRRQGKDWRFIQTQMTHLEEDSQDSYVYDRRETNVQFSQAIYRLVFEEGTRMLGRGADSFLKTVSADMERRGLNVADDIEGVIATAASNFVLVEKLGGVCTRCGQVIKCEDDERTNDLLCAYGLCPNHCHFFFNAAYSYDLAKEKAAVVEHNRALGRVKAVENETRKLQNCVRDFLMPELAELEREIAIRGMRQVVSRHPELTYVVNNLGRVKREVDGWMSL